MLALYIFGFWFAEAGKNLAAFLAPGCDFTPREKSRLVPFQADKAICCFVWVANFFSLTFMICGRGEARPLSCRKDLMSIFCDDFSSRTFTFYIAHAKDMKIKYIQHLSFPLSVISKNIWAEDRIFSVIASDEGPFSFSQDCLYFTGSPIPSLSSEVQTPNLYQKVVQNYHVNKFRIELLLNHFLIGQEIIRYNNEIIEIISFFKKRTYSEYEAEELEE